MAEAPQGQAQVALEGYLIKRSSGGGWKRRFFELTPARIAYYADENKGKVRGELQLRDAYLENVQTSEGLCFRIISEGQSLVLRTQTEAAYDTWRRALAQAVQYQRRMSYASTCSMESTIESIPEAPIMHTVQVGGTEFCVDTKYEIIKVVGLGGFGTVVSATDTESSRKVAIKKVKDIFNSLEDAKRIVREVRVLRSLQHPNIIRIRDAVPPDETFYLADIYIVTDLMPTDLHKVVHHSQQVLTRDHQRFILYQLICAVSYLHSAGILHRDIKPSNVLINEKCQVKLCDFGLARPMRTLRCSPCVSESEPTSPVDTFDRSPATSNSSTPTRSEEGELTEYVVTRWYRAPEVMLVSGRYGTEIDTWSVGCVFGEMLLKKPLFPGSNYLEQLKIITRLMGRPTMADLDFVINERAKNYILSLPPSDGSKFTEQFGTHDSAAVELLRCMLIFAPAQRIYFPNLLRDPFFDECRDLSFELRASHMVDLSDIETLPITRESIQEMMTTELLAVRYGEGIDAIPHHLPERARSFATCPSGTHQFEAQDFDAPGAKEQINFARLALQHANTPASPLSQTHVNRGEANLPVTAVTTDGSP